MSSRNKLTLLPNLFTAASLACGLAAIAHMAMGEFVQSCWLIFFATLLDMCDGTVARLTHTQSAFGGEFDSLADMCVFGIAPGMLFFYLFQPVHPMVAMVVMIAYVLAAAVRLARFNVASAVKSDKSDIKSYFFQGMPTPGAAIGIITLALFYINSESEIIMRAMPWLVLCFAGLMVSKFPYVSSKYFFRSPRLTLELLLVLTVYLWCLVAVKEAREYILLAGLSVYLASGFIMRTANWIKAQDEPEMDIEEEEELEDFNGRF